MSIATTPADASTFRLRRRTPGSFILVPCPSEGRSIRCQGHLEADIALILCACPRVAKLQEQPLVVWYAWLPTQQGCRIRLLPGPPSRRPSRDGTLRISYIVPDFLVSMVDGSHCLLEVKPSCKLDRARVQRKLAVARLFAQSQGWAFQVATEKEIRSGPLLANLRLIRRYWNLRPEEQLVSELTQQVPASGLLLGHLLHHGAGKSVAPVRYQHILYLLSIGQLSFDPRAGPLDQHTVLFPRGGCRWDPFASASASSGCSTDGPTASSASQAPTNSSPSM